MSRNRARQETTNGRGPAPLAQLYNRPGFMIRRAHQIAVALFSEETGDYRVTTTQYGVLWMVRARPNIDQISLAKLMGLDRSTTGLVVSKLEAAGLLVRRNNSNDRRKKVLTLTRSGTLVLARVAAPAQRAQQRLLSLFSKREAREFLVLLDKMISGFATVVRTPILPERAQAGARRPQSSRRKSSKSLQM